MGLVKRVYKDQETVITAENLNAIQDAILALEGGLFSIDNDKSGEAITITDADTRGFRSLNIFGKTTRDGIPTPDAPAELVSVAAGGNIIVNVTGQKEAQSMTIATPNGLPGIPVASGGNYTDANGQQWICDEIDLARGVYVQRVDIREITGTPTLTMSAYGSAGYYRIAIHDVDTALGDQVPSICSHFESKAQWNIDEEYGYVTGNASKAYVYSKRWASESAFIAWIQEQKNNGTPLTYVYQRGEPIETPLTEEELAAYAALHTYKDHTTVSNDSGAYMELEYVMDAKKYFATNGGIPSRLSSVTLLASAWKGADSLYSQVVTIKDVTPYSKVDLLPSVEQLAIFHNKDVAFVTENEDGVVTVYAIGVKPTQDYTMQVQITEVAV